VVVAAQSDRASRATEARAGRPGDDLADPGDPRRAFGRASRGRRDAGQQLEVLAAGGGELRRIGPQLGCDLRHAGGRREAVEVDRQARARPRADVGGVAGDAVGEIDQRVRAGGGERAPLGQPRLGAQVGVDEGAGAVGAPVEDRETLSRLLAGKRWGDSARLALRRGGNPVDATVRFRRQLAGEDPRPPNPAPKNP